MMLTGQQIWNRGTIINGFDKKVDDHSLPSYGLDGMLYTFRADVEWGTLFLHPKDFVILRTFEWVDMPLNCGGLLYLKSTYSRQGIILTTNSPVDPGYKGKLSIGLYNASVLSVCLYGQGGFMQLVMHEMSEDVVAYEGRHQNG